MAGRAPDEKQFREAILITLARTNEPMLSKQIAAYLTRRGWAGNVAARVPSHLTSLRSQGKVASMVVKTGHAFSKNGYMVETSERAWFLSSLPMSEARRILMSRATGRHRFRAPPEPIARTDDMRQMLVDLHMNSTVRGFFNV